MSPRCAGGISAQLGGLCRRFERWRRTRNGHPCIPEAPWASAAKAAGKHGLNRTVRALRLDYYLLKKRVEAATCRRVLHR